MLLPRVQSSYYPPLGLIFNLRYQKLNGIFLRHGWIIQTSMNRTLDHLALFKVGMLGFVSI